MVGGNDNLVALDFSRPLVKRIETGRIFDITSLYVEAGSVPWADYSAVVGKNTLCKLEKSTDSGIEDVLSRGAP